MATHRWTAGDTDPIEVTLRDRGKVIPLVGATVVARFKRYQTTGAVEEVSCTIESPNGKISFVPPVVFNTPGVYLAQWRITFSPGTSAQRILSVPNGGVPVKGAPTDFFDRFEVGAHL